MATAHRKYELAQPTHNDDDFSGHCTPIQHFNRIHIDLKSQRFHDNHHSSKNDRVTRPVIQSTSKASRPKTVSDQRNHFRGPKHPMYYRPIIRQPRLINKKKQKCCKSSRCRRKKTLSSSECCCFCCFDQQGDSSVHTDSRPTSESGCYCCSCGSCDCGAVVVTAVVVTAVVVTAVVVTAVVVTAVVVTAVVVIAIVLDVMTYANVMPSCSLCWVLFSTYT